MTDMLIMLLASVECNVKCAYVCVCVFVCASVLMQCALKSLKCSQVVIHRQVTTIWPCFTVDLLINVPFAISQQHCT